MSLLNILTNYLNRNEVNKLYQLSQLFESGSYDFSKVPSSLYTIIVERLHEKSNIINRLPEKNKNKARIKVINDTLKDYKEFMNQLINGEDIKYPEFFYSLILSLDNYSLDEFSEDLDDILNKLNISKDNKSLHDLFNEITIKLKNHYSPDLKIESSTRIVEFKFYTKSVELNIPDNIEKDLINGLRKSIEEKPKDLDELKEQLNEINEILERRNKKEIIDELKLNENVVDKYIDGKISKENMLRMFVKRLDINEDISYYIVGKAIEKSRQLDVFKSYINGDRSINTRNIVLNTIKELDIYIEDALKDLNLSIIEPKVKSSRIYNLIKSTRKLMSEYEGETKSSEKNITLLFSPEKTLLDVFQGVYSGTCFGDYPYDNIRKELFPIKIFVNGKIKGAVLTIYRKIKGKDAIVIIGFDTSESFVSGLSVDKQREFVDVVMRKVKEFCDKNNFELYITDQAGGISNRSGFANRLRNYFSNEWVDIKETTFHPSYNYRVRRATKVAI